jgi:monoamine oxidase
MDTDILVIGAGVTGLTAASRLKKAGFRVEVVEARDRVGGRILTEFHPLSEDPIELGAELVHGLPEETRQWLDPDRDLEVRDGEFLIFENGHLSSSPSYFGQISEVLEQLCVPLNRDLSFREWLDRKTLKDPQVKEWINVYVQGYHAADSSDISVEALQEIERESQEVDAVEGAQFFRGGQIEFFNRLLRDFAQPIRLSHGVKQIQWSASGAEVHFQQSDLKPVRAGKVVITIPIGVLKSSSQEGSVEFQPQLPMSFLESLSYFKMGTAIRMNFVFHSAPWSLLPELLDFAMILDSSPGAFFRVWWKRGDHQLVGWSGGPSSELAKSPSKLKLQELGIEALARLFKLPQSQVQSTLVGSYTHDWNHDPYSRGVYPYVKVGGRHQVQKFSEPIENVLYFAGDAERLGAYLGTVNGAVRAGARVAREILGHSSLT